jgi:ribosomal protein S18 acetylase RimI-like enzyme
MGEVLNDFSTPALAAAIEANLFEYYGYLGSSAKVELYDSPKMTWLITDIPLPFMNGVFRTQLTLDDVDEAIEDALTHFKSRKMPFMWWAGSAAQPADLGKHLEAHGLIYAEDLPGMAVDLLALNEDLTTPSGLTIRPVGDKKTLKQWVNAAIIGFGVPHTSENACFDLFAGLGFDLPLRNYIGLLDGKPVATSQLFLAAGIAGIYWVTTVPEARRQGIGTALTLASLREARAMGYRISILHSSEIGMGVYRQLGFEEYCQLSYGIWMGERANNETNDGA